MVSYCWYSLQKILPMAKNPPREKAPTIITFSFIVFLDILFGRTTRGRPIIPIHAKYRQSFRRNEKKECRNKKRTQETQAEPGSSSLALSLRIEIC